MNSVGRESRFDATERKKRQEGKEKAGEIGFRQPAKLSARVPGQSAPGTNPTWRRFLVGRGDTAGGGKGAITVVANQPTLAFRSFHVANWPARHSAASKLGDTPRAARAQSAEQAAEQQPSAAAWVRELAETKERLGQELETNLKQLQAILEEGQRIAGDLEMVLRETRCEAPASASVQTSGRRRRTGAIGVRRRSEPRGH